MLENFGVFRYAERMESQLDIVQALRERYERRHRRGQGRHLQHGSHAGARARLHARPCGVMVQAGTRARGEPRRSLASCRLPRAATTSASSTIRSRAGTMARPSSRPRMSGHDEVPARGAQLLMQVALKIWRYDAVAGERALPRVRDRRARGGDAPRLPRHRQGPGRRHARVSQELPDDDLRLVRHAHGRRRRPRVQDADVRDRAGRARAGHLRDGEPSDRQGPRRGHGALLGEDPRRSAVARAGLLGSGRDRSTSSPRSAWT